LNDGSGEGITDLHSHLIPGVDDGARTVEDALEGIDRLWDAGVRKMITTPHLDGSLTHTPSHLQGRLEQIGAAWEKLEAEARTRYPSLVLHRGYEVMLDVPDPVLTDSRIHLADTPFVLVEWPRLQVPPATTAVLGTFREMGIRIILAHPERYRGLDSEVKIAGGWREMGALLQVNYGSLVGRYGDGPRRRAATLLERGWADLFSTDFHGRPHLPLYILEAERAMVRIDGGEQFELMARRNPALVLEGKDPLPVPPLSGQKSLWERLADLFSRRARG